MRDILEALQEEAEGVTGRSHASSSHDNTRIPGDLTSRPHPVYLPRLQLSPLLSMEQKLLQGLDGGYHGEGSREIFMYQGWQLKSLAMSRTGGARGGAPSLDATGRASLETNEPVSEASHLLDACKDYIRDLAKHPTVTRLINSGRIVLKESSTLSVGSRLDHLFSCLILATFSQFS